jgi:hypothetical protein
MALQAASPAIATGTNSGLPSTDQRDQFRSAADIGAYAFNTRTVTPNSPTSSISLPVAGGTFNTTTWDGVLSGTASDNGGGGIQEVQVSIRQSGTGMYWNGSAFVSSSEFFVTATGTTSWYVPFPAANFLATGSYTVHSVATDHASQVENPGATDTFTFNAPLGFAPTSLPMGTVGAAYNVTLTPSNGSGSGYTFSESGTLPAGLAFSSSGTFSGRPIQSGTFAIQVLLSDSIGDHASRSYILTISGIPANVGVFRASTGVWYLDEVQSSYNPATTLQINNFGSKGDIAVSGDWLGIGQAYVGVFRPSTGTWYLSTTNTSYAPANTIQIGNFGQSGDIPVVGHWGSNPFVDYIGVFRPSTHQWFLDEVQGSYNPATTIQINNFGQAGDSPVVGNWGNSSISDGRSYVGVFRPSSHQWFLDEVEGSYNPATTIQINNFGSPGDVPRVGNWLGGAQDGHTYVGVFRPGTGTWYLSKSNTSYTPANTLQIGNFGAGSDIPQVGDWLGTGLTEVGVFRPGTGTWYLSTTNTNYSPANTVQIGNFGTSGDQPAVGAWAVTQPELLQGMPGSDTASLSVAELQTVVSAAIARWQAAGLDSAGAALLEGLHVSIGDLPAGWLGAYVSGSIVLDPTADGDGWSVEPTDAPVANHVDALTVVMHEMGHALGLPDEAVGVMAESLAPGTRNLPTAADVAAAFASGTLVS